MTSQKIATALDALRQALGAAHVLTGADAAPYGQEWTKKYHWQPLAVLRPASTEEVAAAVRIAAASGIPVVPVSGRTGLNGGTHAEGALMLSLARMNHIRDINPATRTAVAEAGVILSSLHDAAAEQGLFFPLWFGARGSAMIGGVLSTNAGGSNVLRYGSTRALCLGMEVVLADGRVMNLQGALYKDNTGYALKDLFIGAEGTLGIITAATLKLVPLPAARATATLALRSLPDALALLNRLQRATGGMVEAFEYMPRGYMEQLSRQLPDLRQPFDRIHDVTILVELAATAPRDAETAPDGTVPLVALLEETLASLMDEGALADAVIARSDAQRMEMWKRREAAAEITLTRLPLVDTDIALPLDRVADFLAEIAPRITALDPRADGLWVGHLGDGNLHYTVYPGHDDPALEDAIREAVEDVVADLHGSFSAEHGIGLSKRGTMARRKDPVALDVMRTIKAALDPQNLLNPGKVLPPE